MKTPLSKRLKPSDWGSNLDFSKNLDYRPKGIVVKGGTKPSDLRKRQAVKELFISIIRKTNPSINSLEQSFFDGFVADTDGEVFKDAANGTYFRIEIERKSRGGIPYNLDEKVRSARAELRKIGMGKISISLVLAFDTHPELSNVKFFVLPIELKKAFNDNGKIIFTYEECLKQKNKSVVEIATQ